MTDRGRPRRARGRRAENSGRALGIERDQDRDGARRRKDEVITKYGSAVGVYQYFGHVTLTTGVTVTA